MIREYIDNDIIRIIIMIPFFSTAILYYIMKWISHHPWKAIHFSTQWSAFLYVVAVSLLLEKHIEVATLGFFIVGILLLLSIHLIVQWKKNTEVILKKGLKLVTRICFLLFSLLYIILISFEIIELLLTKNW
ncbi:MAG TPA: DUF3397 family protein [Pseudogracilibacillus sp.]|nr:DUF3397 family protein [Pseudogracilibacillus sp.]